MTPPTFHTVIASGKWRNVDLHKLKGLTSVIFRERIGIDFLLDPNQGVIIHQDGQNITEQLWKCHHKRPSMKITVISSSFPVDLQLLCEQLGYRFVPVFGDNFDQILTLLLKPKES